MVPMEMKHDNERGESPLPENASADVAGSHPTSDDPARPRRIAVVTMGVKLGDEVKGYTRFKTIAEMLVEAGYQVDLITSAFQHWEKAQRDVDAPAYLDHPFGVVFIGEPGYKHNLDPRRIWSHHVAARNIRAYFDDEFVRDSHAYDLIYAEIPPNDVALSCAEVAKRQGIPFVVDVNDLWPEAMRMALDVPFVSDVLFAPFARDAKGVYELLSAAVGTSDEYAARPGLDRKTPYEHRTVYVGNDLSAFDDGVRDHSAQIQKADGELWVTYAGTLGASYDLETLILASKAAAEVLCEGGYSLRVKILGDGPERKKLEAMIEEAQAPVDLMGYTPYEEMAAWLVASDVMVNSLIKAAPQSIVTKIGDYLAAGRPLINTGSSEEFRRKVTMDGFGVNVDAEDPVALAAAIIELALSEDARRTMGIKARVIAEEQFDRKTAYLPIIDLIGNLTSDKEQTVC